MPPRPYAMLLAGLPGRLAYLAYPAYLAAWKVCSVLSLFVQMLLWACQAERLSAHVSQSSRHGWHCWHSESPRNGFTMQ